MIARGCGGSLLGEWDRCEGCGEMPCLHVSEAKRLAETPRPGAIMAGCCSACHDVNERACPGCWGGSCEHGL